MTEQELDLLSELARETLKGPAGRWEDSTMYRLAVSVDLLVYAVREERARRTQVKEMFDQFFRAAKQREGSWLLELRRLDIDKLEWLLT